uniref:Uncharacterized protein n=1 Tax=Ananas comosus var. bracteatus TaxID=296719 RepID=A0A6V7PP60_ANACO|nr:unnamed protein product [Ananas comosus var. bracteatus]
MSYYNQQQPPVGVPPPQGYPPEGYGKDAYPPPGTRRKGIRRRGTRRRRRGTRRRRGIRLPTPSLRRSSRVADPRSWRDAWPPFAAAASWKHAFESAIAALIKPCVQPKDGWHQPLAK